MSTKCMMSRLVGLVRFGVRTRVNLCQHVILSGPPILSRSMYTDKFLEIDMMKDKRQSARLTIDNVDEVQKQVRERFEESGLKGVLSADLETLMDAIESPEGLRLCLDILRESLDPVRGRQLNSLPTTVKRFFFLCKIFKCPEMAIELWNDPHLNKDRIVTKHTEIIFLTTLYENEMYQEVVDLYNENSSRHINTPLVMAALCKIGSKEAFERATKLMNEIQEHMENNERVSIRCLEIYPYFAYQMGELAIAYDFLTSPRMASLIRRSSSWNMKIELLTSLKRYREALALIKDIIQSERARASSKFGKTEFCYDVLKALAHAIKTEAGDPNLVADFNQVLRELQESSVIQDMTLEDKVFQAISSR